MDQDLKTAIYREALQQLETFRARFSEIPVDQLDTIPFEGSWTPGQLAEHVIRACQSNLRAAAAAEAVADREPDRKVAIIKRVFLNFDSKLSAPEFIRPKELVHDQEAQLAEIEALMVLLKEVAFNAPLERVCTSFSLPNLGELTGIEWLRFMTYHVQRHNRQLEQLSAAR